MNGEMYVTHLSEISRKVRSVIGEFLGEVDKTRQALELRKDDVLLQLAERLRCQKDQVFEVLAGHISALFQNSSLPVFTREHLKLLINPDRHEILGIILGCGPKDALIHLFDPAAVAISLLSIDPNRQLRIDTNTLEFALRSPRLIGSLETIHGAGFNDWGAIIKDEGWLRPEAMDALQAYAQRLDWPGDDVTRVLAAVVTPPESWSAQAAEEGQCFGSLAMVWLHQRVMHTVMLLREESISLAREAASYLPTHTAVANLAPWIELYERGAVARAVPYLVAAKKPLGCFLARDSCSDKMVSGQPEPNQTLILSNQETYFTFWGTRGRFNVLCQVRGEESPRIVLHCKGLRVSTYEHLIREVARLESNDLSQVGKTIAERVLNTPILIPDPFLSQIMAAVKSLGPTFAQCLVLSGAPCSIEMNAPWKQELPNQLPFRTTPIEKEAYFPYGISEIAEKLRSEAGPHTRIITS